MTDLRLRPATVADEAAVTDAQRLMLADDFPFCFRQEHQSWQSYLATIDRERVGLDLPDDRVPATFLLAVVDARLVGRVSIRHRLNDWLLAHGGHIGYCVLPGHRRRGYATEILRQSLVIARSVGVDRALITCDDDNVGSVAVIERNGGCLDAEWPRATENGVVGRRYWID